jgi:hypothetical protein
VEFVADKLTLGQLFSPSTSFFSLQPMDLCITIKKSDVQMMQNSLADENMYMLRPSVA